MNSYEIRQQFISFFEKKKHERIDSSSLVPLNDPTLLFANAGMNQFKDIFTGQANPKNKRAVSIQKCVRAGGKHNDLENVGFTARHHTFFEMMGNFSFGDYFKKDAISFAWEFLTQELNISKDKLYITVHHSDNEAADIWHKEQGVPKERIFFFGDKDNFWEMGEVGPCGPCSEIFFDHGEEHTDPNADTSECILGDEQRYVEIWNLVFMQYEKYKNENGQFERRDLPKPCVDTGAGLERVAAAMQGKYNNFDTDCFTSLMDEIEKISGKKYQDHLSFFRVVADHARAVTMLLTDGVLPSNEGRGYVLRRIIRRAVRHLDLLGVKEVKFFTLAQIVLKSFGKVYVENEKNLEFAKKYMRLEEESFRKTLSSGMKLLDEKISNLKRKKESVLGGTDVFTLYDTHGFPVDLTELILEEHGLHADLDGFEKEMQIQRERSKGSSDFSSSSMDLKPFYDVKEKSGVTVFEGYDSCYSSGKLLATITVGEKTALVFDRTPFYAESGGQAGDIGVIDNIEVLDTVKPVEGIHAHIVKGHQFEIGKEYSLKVNERNRNLTMRNHTATHLLQSALIEVLGEHIKQSGSSVSSTRLRFDFTHPESVTLDEIKKVEEIVNDQIQKEVCVMPEVMSKDAAIKKGAMALFGEKYGDEVRVIDVLGFSVELCGGTHVQNTSEIAHFQIVSEGSLSAGVRRIEAVTSEAAMKRNSERMGYLDSIEFLLKVKGIEATKRVEQLLNDLNKKQKTINELNKKISAGQGKDLIDGAEKLGDHDFKHIIAPQGSDIRQFGDMFMDKYKKGFVVITCAGGEKSAILVKTFKGSSLNCGRILKETLSQFDGRGGGRPEMAQGSLPEQSIAQAVEFIKGNL